MSVERTEDRDVTEWVAKYYGETLKGSEDLATNACCATGGPPPHVRGPLSNVHTDVTDRFYGCGFPIPDAVRGLTVVDLGCGTGRDVYILAQLVGEEGFVHGVDMTEAQLATARETAEWHRERFGYAKSNVAFHQGYIEDLRMIEDNSVDLVVSNCVVNLSPRKDLVLAEIARILKPGGELYISDVVCDRRLPKDIAFDPLLHSECLGGAMTQFDFEQLGKSVGFRDPRVTERAPITINNDAIRAKVGAARFESVTLRMFALDGLDARCEDYGQIATYKGTIPEAGTLFRLDDHHLFEAGRPERVCGNTAAMLRDTRFGPHFDVVGDESVHFGEYPCGPTLAHAIYGDDATSSVAASASSGSCC